MISKYPNNWKSIRLGNICSFNYGKGLTKAKRDKYGPFPVYGSNGIVGYHSQYIVEGPCLIVGRKGAAGAVHYSKENCWPIDTTYFIKMSSDHNDKYFYYLFKNLRLDQHDKSTAIPGLNRNDAYDLEIPLPPLPTQHRIVDKIEELFSELDSGVGSLKRAKEQIGLYKQSVLRAAFSGNLVRVQELDVGGQKSEVRGQRSRQKDGGQADIPRAAEPGGEYKSLNHDSHDSRITMIRSDKSEKKKSGKSHNQDNQGSDILPEGWKWFRAEEVCSSVRDGTHDTPKYQDKGYPLITSKNLKYGNIDFDNVRYISGDDYKEINKRSKVDNGDVLFAMIGTIGNPVVIQTNKKFSIKNVGLFKKNENVINSYYLRYWLESPQFFSILNKKELIKGTTQKFIPLGHLRILPVPLPETIEQQHQIVAEIERRFSEAENLEKSIDEGLAKAEALRQSILKQAFEGKLVQ